MLGANPYNNKKYTAAQHYDKARIIPVGSYWYRIRKKIGNWHLYYNHGEIIVFKKLEKQLNTMSERLDYKINWICSLLKEKKKPDRKPFWKIESLYGLFAERTELMILGFENSKGTKKIAKSLRG